MFNKLNNYTHERNNNDDKNISKKVFGSVNDLPAKDKIAIVQGRLEKLQIEYYGKTLDILSLQNKENYSGKDFDIDKLKLTKTAIESSYVALQKELKRLEDSNNEKIY